MNIHSHWRSGPSRWGKHWGIRLSNLEAANPSSSRKFLTHSKQFRSMAMIRRMIAPRSMECIPSRDSNWWTQKCWTAQKVLCRRFAPHSFLDHSQFLNPASDLSNRACHLIYALAFTSIPGEDSSHFCFRFQHPCRVPCIEFPTSIRVAGLWHWNHTTAVLVHELSYPADWFW